MEGDTLTPIVYTFTLGTAGSIMLAMYIGLLHGLAVWQIIDIIVKVMH